MSELGHRAPSTPAERAEVLRLREAGVAIRRIAVEVFGDERFRGRVERIVKPTAASGLPACEPIDLEEFAGLDATAQFRLLAERRRHQWLVSGRAPSMRELKAMLDVERALDAREQVERARERHQQRRRPKAEGDQSAR